MLDKHKEVGHGCAALEGKSRKRLLALSAEIPFSKQAIVERTTGTAIGYAGVDYFEFQGERRLDFGVRLIAESRGNGFATEAALAILELARETCRGQLLAFIDSQNHPSRNDLNKLRFELVELSPASRDTTLNSTTSPFERVPD